MSVIERMLNRLEEKILVRSAEVTGQQGGREGFTGPFPSLSVRFQGEISTLGHPKSSMMRRGSPNVGLQKKKK